MEYPNTVKTQGKHRSKTLRTSHKFYQKYYYKYRVDDNPDALERIVWETKYHNFTFRRNVVNDLKLVANLSASLSQKVKTLVWTYQVFMFMTSNQYEHTRCWCLRHQIITKLIVTLGRRVENHNINSPSTYDVSK